MTSTQNTQSTTAQSTTAAKAIALPIAGAFLLVDAAMTGVNGLAYLLAGSWLADWFGAPVGLVRELGVFLVVVAIGVAVLATRTAISRRWVMALAELNFVWVAASIGYAVMADLTTLGVAWTLLQGAIVGAFAVAQVWLARKG